MSYYAAIKPMDIANGPGVRVSVFLSGCPHHCPGCFNQEAWDYQYGTPMTCRTLRKIHSLLRRPHIQGLTLLGGEPLDPRNINTASLLAIEAKEMKKKKDVWCYTGYLFEEILAFARTDSEQGWRYRRMLSACDVLVDGRFQREQADKGLTFKGSANQRVIDVPASLKQGAVVLWEDPYAYHPKA